MPGDPIGPTDVQLRLFTTLGTGHREWLVMPGCDHAAHLERCKGRFESAFIRFVREVAGAGGATVAIGGDGRLPCGTAAPRR